ncbi:PQQ-dependent sugar dehydrogenase [Pedobacter puniceum]|uniref:C-type cytochrome n=1 Tax=Pedobacter puniceum TaxID=2666136 RepID=A0A7K0FKW5_9SPHI|nr:PQQ-dependent sugar dehydrogenase [Pedobacter puniceum]MRX46588.1 c-type cytochrome [Pedobacter puniceum]
MPIIPTTLTNRALSLIILLSVVWCSCSKPENKDLTFLDNVKLESSILKVETLQDSLEVPWDIAITNNNFLFFTEQYGAISYINLETHQQQKLLVIPEVWHQRTAGLLAMAVHPDFKQNPYVYVHYTTKTDTLIFNKLVRYTFKGDTLESPKELLKVKGFKAHNGGRITFSKSGKILWATGDAYHGDESQDLNFLNGKILRLNPDGSIPADNPNPKSYVWARGFRNMQGITVTNKGNVFTSEHGDAIEDEVNLIEKNRNYGWPAIEGLHNLPEEIVFAQANNTKEPVKSWTPVIAPAGIAYYGSASIPEWNNSLLLTTLKGQSLRVLKLNEEGKAIVSEEIFFENYYGRLRDVCVDANGVIYISTSNKDWKPQVDFPLPGDDKILKISISDKVLKKPLTGLKAQATLQHLNAAQLYQSYCVSCHQADGKGVKDVFPALAGSAMVNGPSTGLIKAVLNGINRKENPQKMPSFAFLKDQELADILIYIRQNWGNQASKINETEIAQNR